MKIIIIKSKSLASLRCTHECEEYTHFQHVVLSMRNSLPPRIEKIAGD